MNSWMISNCLDSMSSSTLRVSADFHYGSCCKVYVRTAYLAPLSRELLYVENQWPALLRETGRPPTAGNWLCLLGCRCPGVAQARPERVCDLIRLISPDQRSGGCLGVESGLLPQAKSELLKPLPCLRMSAALRKVHQQLSQCGLVQRVKLQYPCQVPPRVVAL